MNKMNQKQLFQFINEVSFALDDITLYLDTHPMDRDALAAYENYQAMRRQAVKDYTTYYGPLNRYDVNAGNSWSWINDPWPWQGEV